MGIVTSAGAYEFGLAKQTNESTIPTVAAYAMPVFSGGPHAMQTVARIEVTDAASIVGDPYKNADEHWEADVVHPAFADSLGLELVSLWPTDTATGTAPSKVHTFSGLGSTAAWVSMYANFTNASLQQTYEAGQCSGIGFSCDGGGGPLRINYKAVGKKPTVAAYTKTVTNALTDGYFTAQGAVLKYEEDNATPIAQTNIQSVGVTVDRTVTAIPTADGLFVSNMGIGRVEPAFTMSLLYSSWDAYRNTFYGTAAGSVPAATFATGSVELNFVHTITATWTLKLTLPKVWMVTTPPDPDAGGAPLALTIAGQILKPASGDHVVPVLTNSVATAY